MTVFDEFESNDLEDDEDSDAVTLERIMRMNSMILERMEGCCEKEGVRERRSDVAIR
jgi:hypothetical protein